MYWYKSMMSIEPRNEPRMLRSVVSQDVPSYNLQPLLLKRYQELEEARAFNNWLGERRQAQEGQRHLDDVSRLTEAVHRQWVPGGPGRRGRCPGAHRGRGGGGNGGAGRGHCGRRSERAGTRHGLGAGEHALPAPAGQRGRGRAGRPVRQQHE